MSLQGGNEPLAFYLDSSTVLLARWLLASGTERSGSSATASVAAGRRGRSGYHKGRFLPVGRIGGRPHRLTSKVTVDFRGHPPCCPPQKRGRQCCPLGSRGPVACGDRRPRRLPNAPLTPGAIRTFELFYFTCPTAQKVTIHRATVEAVGWWRDAVNGRDHVIFFRGYAYHGGVYALEGVLPYLTGQGEGSERRTP